MPPILPPVDGFLFLDREKFAESFAADLRADEAAFMADSQLPWGVEALNGTVTEPVWRIKPSWYLVATDDRMIPPPAQRAMSERAGATVVEHAGSHSTYVSQPHTTAELIKQSAQSALSRPPRRCDRELTDQQRGVPVRPPSGGTAPAGSPLLGAYRRPAGCQLRARRDRRGAAGRGDCSGDAIVNAYASTPRMSGPGCVDLSP